MTPTWTSPPTWPVPREWEPGTRCFVICGGESIRKQRKIIPKLKGRVIAIKQGVVLRPDADVLFLSGERTADIATPLLPMFRGTHVIVRGKSCPELPDYVKRITRSKDHTVLSDLPDHVCGYDAGTSAINLAFHFGATEIVMLGYDMRGGRWFNGEIDHHMPRPPESHFQRHMAPLPALAKDCSRRGIRVVNCSPRSHVDAFEKQPLEAFL